ncbi:hypothetical protein [Nocardia miyunensis]|uniref:hypothetical protein n=1 Tax=Nocardia miyunensis TaxID=282684 RepID=UPI001FE12857|nr:hypothetical protein [Nocardia miyunensis]
MAVGRMRRWGLFTLVGVFLLVGMSGVAGADAPSSGGDVAVAQTLGDRELTVVLRRVTSVPGPLQVEVVTHAGSAGGRLSLALTSTGASSKASSPPPGVPTDRGAVQLGNAPGMYSTTLRVDRPGPWELAIDDGRQVARIPFVVSEQVTTPPERFVYGGFLAAGVLLPVSILVAVRARRSAWALLPAGGMVAGLAVAITAAVLSASLPLPPQPGVQLDPDVDNVSNPYALGQPLVSDFSRPPVMLGLSGAPLSAGQPGDLDLNLTDAATGAPVDDLIIEDGALIHLLAVGPGGELWHLHPIRIAPGHFRIQFTPPEAGHYALSAELARRGGGVQMVRAASGFTVAPGRATGTAPPHTANPVHLGHGVTTTSTTVDATPITVTTTAATAGTPITLTATVGNTSDLQPWLGMVGHMIVAGPLPDSDTDIGTAVQNAPVWGHAHSMGGMSMPGMNNQSGSGTTTSGMATPDVHSEPGPIATPQARSTTPNMPGMNDGSATSTPPMPDMPGMSSSSGTSNPVMPNMPGMDNSSRKSTPNMPNTPGMNDNSGTSTPVMPNMPGMNGGSDMNAPNPGMNTANPGGAMLMFPVNGDSAPDETVAAYGPAVPFTFTFLAPGHYRVWIQVERNYSVITIPVVLDVEPSGASR